MEGGGVEWKEKEDWMKKEGRRKGNKKTNRAASSWSLFYCAFQSPDIYVVYFFCS